MAVVDLDLKTSTGVQGRFVYRTDTTHPVRGGCSNETVTGETLYLSDTYINLSLALHVSVTWCTCTMMFAHHTYGSYVPKKSYKAYI